ncbi:MAG TPA: hypothetical protein VGL86_01365 [Polyangia bacterium]|jgi:tetratricopeptide (TPR) repeat protein
MLHRRPFLPALALLLIAFAAPPAHADANDDCADAGEHLRIARRAVTVHDYATAIAHFKASYELDGQPLTLIFLARAYVADGDLFSAIELYRSYLEVEPSSRRTFDVEAEIARLSQRLLTTRIAIFDDN